MDTEQKKIISIEEPITFTQRLDFYWQFISVYSVALIIYFFFRGTIIGQTFSIVLLDPVVILLLIFILGSSLQLGINYYKNYSIIISKESIIFKNRFREKRYNLDDVQKISIGRERVTLRKNKVIRIIKIKVSSRRRTIKIRPISFSNPKELVVAITQLKILSFK